MGQNISYLGSAIVVFVIILELSGDDNYILSIAALLGFGPSIIFGPIAGVVADRFNKTHLITLGGIISAIGMALFPLSKTFFHILGARLLFSAGSALMMPALSAIAAIEGREYGVGTTMSVLQSAMSLGMMGGPLLSGIFADMFSLKPIFYVGSGISFLGLIIFHILQPRGKPAN